MGPSGAGGKERKKGGGEEEKRGKWDREQIKIPGGGGGESALARTKKSHLL